MQLYLASTSPRRRFLLDQAGIEHVLAIPGPEPAGSGMPIERCRQRARSKAQHARIPAARGLVLGVDTVVELEDRELEKPGDRAAARAMLQQLARKVHRVHTAHCLWVSPSGPLHEQIASAQVRCAHLSADEIELYLDAGEWHDKAGGYGIQASAGRFMSLIEGERDTVIGLSVRAVRELLARAGETE